MSSLRLRPRFRLRTELTPDEVMQRFMDRMDAGEVPLRINLFEHQVEITVLPKDAHLWSPFLNLLISTEDGQTVLRGKYGPNVDVWTALMAAYAVLGMVGTVAVIVGLSKGVVKESPTGWYALGAGCVVGIGIAYLVGLGGRTLARPQMEVVHAFLAELFTDELVELEDEEHDG